ncbi:MAG: hypothetical protein NC543_02515 [bacterium]|nr:hypothetical protein [bacterium]MCM1374235.1 hypothetical protein [Muribaculum sp.]
MLLQRQSYEDYKYVMADVGNVYLGAKYTYGELLQNEDVPFKIRAIVERYILPDADAETTLESDFYYMSPDSFAYKTYRQLKVKVKCSRIVKKKSLFSRGKSRQVYTTELIDLENFTTISPADKQAQGIVIQEIVINKLAMMTFTV